MNTHSITYSPQDYAALGYAIVPLKTGGKPIKATPSREPAIIEKWVKAGVNGWGLELGRAWAFICPWADYSHLFERFTEVQQAPTLAHPDGKMALLFAGDGNLFQHLKGQGIEAHTSGILPILGQWATPLQPLAELPIAPEAIAKGALRFAIGVQPPEPKPPKDHPLEGLESEARLGTLPRYAVTGGVIRAAKAVGQGIIQHNALANFAARITREIAATDGQTDEIYLEVEGFLASGEPLGTAVVRASEFPSMAWVLREWGTRAIVEPGQAVKDTLRAAIQTISKPQRAKVFAHLGWARIGSEWGYIHSAGAIGPTGPLPEVELRLSRALQGFALPDPPKEPAQAVQALLELANIGPIWPALLYAMGAPLGHAPFALYIAGPTGSRKTSLALVLQGLQGWTEPHPVLGWEASANALEGYAFFAKDSALLVDDYAPTGPERVQRELQAKAARILRSQGNATSRARMRASGELGPDRPPRGALLITGEDTPPGHSVRARCLIVELGPSSLDLEALSQAQAQAQSGLLAQGFAAWVQHLAADPQAAQQAHRARVQGLRPTWASGAHGRTVDALAHLHAILERFLAFALGVKAISPEEAEGLEAQALEGLQRVGKAQAAAQAEADPAKRFPALLAGLFAQGRAHLEAARGAHDENIVPRHWEQLGWAFRQGAPAPMGRRIGYFEAECHLIYLEPEAAYPALNALAAELGEPLPMPRTLWQKLGQAGLIATHNEAGELRTTAKISINGSRKRVLAFPFDPTPAREGLE